MGLYLYGNIRNHETKKMAYRKMTLGYETNELTSVDIDTELDFIFCETIFNSSLYKNFISSQYCISIIYSFKILLETLPK